LGFQHRFFISFQDIQDVLNHCTQSEHDFFFA